VLKKEETKDAGVSMALPLMSFTSCVSTKVASVLFVIVIWKKAAVMFMLITIIRQVLLEASFA